MAALKLYDTTLRDGSQAEGISYSVMDKIRIAEELDKIGMHFIEGGWPGSNPKDREFFKKIIRSKISQADSSTAYWEKRARRYGPRAVLNIEHPASEMEEVTQRQKDFLLPL